MLFWLLIICDIRHTVNRRKTLSYLRQCFLKLAGRSFVNLVTFYFHFIILPGMPIQRQIRLPNSSNSSKSGQLFNCQVILELRYVTEDESKKITQRRLIDFIQVYRIMYTVSDNSGYKSSVVALTGRHQ